LTQYITLRALFTLALLCLALFMSASCGGVQRPNWDKVRAQANSLQAEVNAIRADVAKFATPLTVACTRPWAPVLEQHCPTAVKLYEAAGVALDAADRAIRLYDATGLMYEEMTLAVDRLRKEARALDEHAKRLADMAQGAI